MYYDTELLRKRRGGLGTFWLAATLGTSNTRFKKLSKKDVLACNVPKACQKLIEPDEPLALRLSSNLMLGVTRVYSQQCVLLHQDTTSTHAALRKAIVQMWDSGSGLLDPTAGGKHAHALAGGAAFGTANKGAVGGIDQDAHKERGRVDAINLRRDRDEDLMLLDAGFGDQDGGGAEGGATTGRAARGGAFGLGAPRRGGAMLFGGIDDLAWQALEDELRGHPAERGRAQGQGSPGLDDEFEIGSVRGAGDDDEEYREGAAASRAKREKKPAARKATATTAREEDITLPAHLNMQEDMFEPQEYGYDQVEMGDANFELGLDLEETHNLKLPPALAARRARSSSAGAGAASGLLPSTDRASGTGRYEGSSSVGLGRHGTLPPSPPREGDHEGEADRFAAAGMAFDVDLGMGVDHTHDHDHGGGGHDFGAGELDAPLGLDADRAGPPIRLREGSAARADGNESERAASVLPTPPPSTDKKKRKAASRSRSKKAHKVLEDDVIMLETKDLQRARDAYSAEMKSMNRAAERAEYEKVHRARALQMMSGVPKGVGAPLLVEFLKDAYSIAHLVKEPEKRERKSRTTVAGPAGRADAGNGDDAVLGKRTRDQDDVIERRRRDREGTAVSSALGRGAAGRAASLGPGGYDPLDYQDGFDGGAGDSGPDAPAGDYDARPLREGSAVPSSVERGRGRSRALSHIGGEGEIGRGRQRSASVSYSQQMPWMKPAPEDYSSVLVPGAEASSSARDLSIRHSIVGGTPERIRSGHSRSSSAFRDLPGVARRSPTPLDRECRQGSMPLLGDDNDYLPASGDGYDAERGRATTDRDGGSVSRDAQRNELKRSNASGSDRRIRTDSLSSSRYSSSADDSQTRVARSQEQTARFLDYARNVAQAESGRLHLSDIAPVVGSNPTIAAAAFYQVLVLATRGLMKIQSQEEAYGEIHLLCI